MNSVQRQLSSEVSSTVGCAANESFTNDSFFSLGGYNLKLSSSIVLSLKLCIVNFEAIFQRRTSPFIVGRILVEFLQHCPFHSFVLCTK